MCFTYGIVRLAASRPTTVRERVRRRITRLLEDRGHTQRAFARALGHNDAWASHLLGGAFSLSMDDLDKAAEFLGVPPGEIVAIAGNAWELTPTEERAIRGLRMLPTAVRDHVVTHIDYLIGSTPEEVALLKQVRELNEENFPLVERLLDVLLRAQARGLDAEALADLMASIARPEPSIHGSPAQRKRRRTR